MNRNELITYIQMQRGMKMASVVYLDGRQEFIAGTRQANEAPSGKEYFYKVRPGADVAVGDLWAAQARDTFALVRVVKVWNAPPAGVDLGSQQWKYLVTKINTDASDALLAEEAHVFEQIARIEMQTKMAEISKALGFDVSQVEIPSLADTSK
jgi:hypothetical protein